MELADVREAEPAERDVLEERYGALLDQVKREQVDEEEAQVLGACRRAERTSQRVSAPTVENLKARRQTDEPSIVVEPER
jgi:hypothetical protein